MEKNTDGAAAPAPESVSAGTPIPLWPDPEFLMELSSAPLWFEFQGGALVKLELPVEASLNDFIPWALAPHVTGIVPLNSSGGLALAVNGIGFFTVFPWETAEPDAAFFAVKKISGGTDFAGFTCSKPFVFNRQAAVILFNVDFFSDIPADALGNRVYSLADGAKTLSPVVIPAFSAFPINENWEIKDFFISNEGMTWFSALKNDRKMPKRIYCSTDSSLQEATYQEISLGEFRKAAQGRVFGDAPPLLRAVLDRAQAEIAPAAGKTIIAHIYSYKTGAYTTWYQNGGEEIEEIFGFSTEGAMPLAVVCDSAGLLVSGKAGALTVRQLPPLPDNFVWTAISLCGNAVVAAWEEREQWNIGAAGLAFWSISYGVMP
jgi:hypothetical protein